MTRFEPGDDPDTRRAKGGYESHSASNGQWVGCATLVVAIVIAVLAWLGLGSAL